MMDQSWSEAIQSSLEVGVISSGFAVLLAVGPLLRWRLLDSRLAPATLMLGSLGFVLPPVVLAIGISRVLQAVGLFDTKIGLAIAHLVFTLPVAIAILSVSFWSKDVSIYKVATSLGADCLRAAFTWMRATQVRGLFAAFLLAVMISVAEANVVVYATDTRVAHVTRRVLEGFSRELDPGGFAAGTLWLVCALISAILIFRLTGDET